MAWRAREWWKLRLEFGYDSGDMDTLFARCTWTLGIGIFGMVYGIRFHNIGWR